MNAMIMNQARKPRLSIGPVPYYWPADRLHEFYRDVAAAPIDTVYLGETVCAKRREFRPKDWLEIADMLTDQEKEVVFSTLSLIEAGSELGAVRRICENGRFLVEANDMNAVQILSAAGLPFATGPSVNVYNPRTLDVLARKGLKRWVLPVELSRDCLADMQRQRPEGVETEVFSYGRLPLAYSARCYTARAYNLPKDDCQFRCLDHPDGMLLKTRDDTEFLTLNGIQTQSARSFNLIRELASLTELGVDLIRISPQSEHTLEIIEIFNDCLSGASPGEGACDRMESWMPTGPCDGYWHGGAGMDDTQKASA